MSARQLEIVAPPGTINTSGAVLLEFMLVSGLLLMFLGGVTSIGLVTQDILAAEKAVHYAARAGAAQCRSYSSLAAEPAYSLECASSAALNLSLPPASLSPALSRTAQFGCVNLISAGFSPAEWAVSAAIQGPVCEGGFCKRFVKVAATTTRTQRTFGAFGVGVRASNVSAMFALEGSC